MPQTTRSSTTPVQALADVVTVAGVLVLVLLAFGGAGAGGHAFLGLGLVLAGGFLRLR